MEGLILLILIAFASAAISFTITTTTIFSWFREWVSPWHKKVEEWVHCPWCLGHYVALGILLIFWDKTFFLCINPILHLILNWFAVMAVTGILHHVLLRAYEPVASVMLERELRKRKANGTS